MSYHTLAEPCQANLIIKKSEFIAHAYPLHTREKLANYLHQLKSQYPDARHICYGYIIGNPNNTTSAGFDDDGEPNGTAGRPILNVLQHKSIGNVVVFVVRYFGGIKLGAGGLTRAYGDATQLVVHEMRLEPFVPMTVVTVQTDFANEAFVRHITERFSAVIVQVDYAKNVQLQVQLAEKNRAEFVEKLGIYATVQSE